MESEHPPSPVPAVERSADLDDQSNDVQAVAICVTVDDDGWRAALATADGQPRDDVEAVAEQAARAALAARGPVRAAAELGITLTGDAAVRDLNRDWRGRDATTNVLAFPMDAPDDVALGGSDGDASPVLLGDVVLAWPRVAEEAAAAGRPVANHLRHLVVHGVLHLLGYDHIDEADAEEMESMERTVLAALGVPDPYADPEAPGNEPGDAP